MLKECADVGSPLAEIVSFCRIAKIAPSAPNAVMPFSRRFQLSRKSVLLDRKANDGCDGGSSCSSGGVLVVEEIAFGWTLDRSPRQGRVLAQNLS